MFGAIGDDGSQIFMTSNVFTSDEYIGYLKLILSRVNKIILVVDRAPQHRSQEVKEFLKTVKHRLRIIYILTASPYLNPTEEGWHRGKMDPRIFVPHKTVQDLRDAIATFYRTT